MTMQLKRCGWLRHKDSLGSQFPQYVPLYTDARAVDAENEWKAQNGVPIETADVDTAQLNRSLQDALLRIRRLEEEVSALRRQVPDNR